MVDYVAEEVQEARDALADAKKFQQIDVTDKAIVNRLYYACFHAAKAVLYSKGFDPSTHQGVVSLFGEEVVLVDDARGLSGLKSLQACTVGSKVGIPPCGKPALMIEKRFES